MEKARMDRIELGQVTNRVVKATTIGHKTVCTLNSEADLDEFDRSPEEKQKQNMTVDDAFVYIIRRTHRDFILIQKKLPTLDNIMEMFKTPTSDDVPAWNVCELRFIILCMMTGCNNSF